MSIRIPTQTVLNSTLTDTGTASVSGGVPLPFLLPQDTDNVVVKFQASVVGAAASAIFQTSDDGGSTYYDVARTSIVSNANATTAQWLSIPVIQGTNVRSSLVATGSVIAVTNIGSAAASTVGSGQSTGLPILGTANRVFVVYTGNITTSSIIVAVKANSQNRA
jgi:hypothetical protein